MAIRGPTLATPKGRAKTPTATKDLKRLKKQSANFLGLS